SDRLYFEPLTKEDVGNILEIEKPKGVIVQFGGQTAIKLAKAITDMGYKIIGTQLKDIDAAEDREIFDRLLGSLKIKRPEGKTCFTAEQAINDANEFGYPVLVRPSYVLGGQGMEIAYNDKNIQDYMDIINVNTQEHPILIDKYIMGKELEVDAICDGEDILIPGIMEHIERTGVHSGDSISVYPHINLSDEVVKKIIAITKQLAVGLNTIGLINIQFILKDGELYIIEVNPRSSRTVPYISKVTGIPMVKMATYCSLGKKLKDMGFGTGLYKRSKVYAVKVPVFSNEKIPSLEISLSPEMKSTGEVLGLSYNFSEALFKGLLATNLKLKRHGAVFISVSDGYKQEMIPLALEFSRLGFDIYATSGTANVLNHNFIAASVVNKISNDSTDIIDLLKSGKLSYIINTPTKGRNPQRDGFKIRRLSVEMGLPCFTSIDTANAVVNSLKYNVSEEDLDVISLQDIN
ncbi:MAG: ATP-grasp domain-containing protein, partial [Clostridia bacterium]|nr:ATP-grasp domain-containing protein [Clostridia bacterium]